MLIRINSYFFFNKKGAATCFKEAYDVIKNDCEEKFEAKKCYESVREIIIKMSELNDGLSNEKKIVIFEKLGDLFADLYCYSISLEYYNKARKIHKFRYC